MITALLACAITILPLCACARENVQSDVNITELVLEAPLFASPDQPTQEKPSYAERKKRAVQKHKDHRAQLPSFKSHEPKRISSMNYEELVEAKNYQLDRNNLTSAIKYVKQILKMAPNPQAYMYHMIELGDLLFAHGDYVEALQIYTAFCQTHAGNPLSEYAGIRAIICSLIQTRDNDRDQSQTEATILLADQFLTRSSMYQTYTPLAQEIRTLCYHKLIATEANIFQFYIKQNNLIAARKRLDYINTTWIEKMPELTPQYKELETIMLACETKGSSLDIIPDVSPLNQLGSNAQKNELLARMTTQVSSPLTRITV